mmetsp:Transcript_48484/g.161725  ORF Transcript_48484/g.161725 Transcript_48484/m.161725 type:complete len:117 (-) Transcript_48484:26-376(-)
MGKLDLGIGKFAAALAEIATVACFLVYIGTYYRSFAATRITFAVEVNTERSDPVWSDPLARQGGWSPLRGAAEMKKPRFAERFAAIRRDVPRGAEPVCLCEGERRGRTPSPRPPPL